MKRTNLVLEESLLDATRAAAGVRTYSEAVNIAMESYVRRQTFAKVDLYASTDIWDGEVAEMRGDVPR